ncbi:MAG: hypothetical protein WKF87_02065 [Chryseolinea sp.]
MSRIVGATGRLKWFLVGVIVIVCCEKNGSKYSLPAQVDSIAMSFIKEAGKRGLTINLQQQPLKIQFGDLPKGKSASCKPKSFPKVVTTAKITGFGNFG